MRQNDVIDTIATALRDAPGIRALFLSGSHGNGLADDYSDIDFVMVAIDGASDEAAETWRNAVSRTGDIVLWWDRSVRPAIINAITEDWTRTDVVIQKPDQLTWLTKDGVKPLFDHDGLFDSLPDTAEKGGPNPARLKYQFEEFIRIVGLLHLAIGRKEYINGVAGLFHLRNLLVDLLIEETAAPNRGGVLHLNRLITQEQKELLMSLPPAVPEHDALISANVAYARAYLPRARKLAQQQNIDWPERFEAATWKLLNASLGIIRPYDPD
ncbi:aminoglycoside 6-adenylyltransferase [Hoeflea prorocentri]|uniref:Aminoglycoside 6-adenylyltransferase n=1 Tax=Hoeflea prorocentri TaxID=1922333 RepID=A0A9X3UJS4_9HYPH|nr:aminoglycoside 6-adenylyltransferase [Hoeflea prorocentri]MCY6382637.1 aminoglycoside 6-adenylyltransferase [Hoeflea prorocentri]MDA5400437.1 aminoglycoside 6-adenylyltransferase [Hoeflea prorocentri]